MQPSYTLGLRAPPTVRVTNLCLSSGSESRFSSTASPRSRSCPRPSTTAPAGATSPSPPPSPACSSTSSRSPRCSTPPTTGCQSTPTSSRSLVSLVLAVAFVVVYCDLPHPVAWRLRPAHRLPARPRPRIPARRTSVGSAAQRQQLDLPPHRSAARRLRRPLPLAPRLHPLSRPGAPPQDQAARHPLPPAPRDHRPDRPQDPPVWPPLHDRRAFDRLRARRSRPSAPPTSTIPRCCSPSPCGSLTAA